MGFPDLWIAEIAVGYSIAVETMSSLYNQPGVARKHQEAILVSEDITLGLSQPLANCA